MKRHIVIVPPFFNSSTHPPDRTGPSVRPSHTRVCRHQTENPPPLPTTLPPVGQTIKVSSTTAHSNHRSRAVIGGDNHTAHQHQSTSSFRTVESSGGGGVGGVGGVGLGMARSSMMVSSTSSASHPQSHQLHQPPPPTHHMPPPSNAWPNANRYGSGRDQAGHNVQHQLLGGSNNHYGGNSKSGGVVSSQNFIGGERSATAAG